MCETHVRSMEAEREQNVIGTAVIYTHTHTLLGQSSQVVHCRIRVCMFQYIWPETMGRTCHSKGSDHTPTKPVLTFLLWE